MEGYWITHQHHLALEVDGSVIHPSAKDMYAAFSGKSVQGVFCPNPQENLTDIRFSKFGSEILVSLTNNVEKKIQISFFANRRGSIVPVDVIDGIIVDQCVYDGTWFYLSGNVEELQDVLQECGIVSSGTITIRQYLKLVEYDLLNDHRLIDNQVDVSALEAPINEKGSAPSTLKAQLFPYQRAGYLWLKYMLEETQGCILGDEMGLGKTMQVICELLYLKSTGTILGC